MKPFETVLKQLQSMGFIENQPRFNKHQLMLSLKIVLGALMVGANLLYAADTSEEYMNGILAIVTMILILIAYVSTVFKTATIFIFINQFNEIIKQSEWK